MTSVQCKWITHLKGWFPLKWKFLPFTTAPQCPHIGPGDFFFLICTIVLGFHRADDYGSKTFFAANDSITIKNMYINELCLGKFPVAPSFCTCRLLTHNAFISTQIGFLWQLFWWLYYLATICIHDVGWCPLHPSFPTPHIVKPSMGNRSTSMLR